MENQNQDAVGRVATEADFSAVSDCLTSAFFNDPVWGMWSFPDERTRAGKLRLLLGFWARAATRHGSVWMMPGAESAAAWIPPGAVEMTEADEAAFPGLVSELFGERSEEASALFEEFERQHPATEPHHYLSLWGTHRDHAGRGIGAVLINECLARIDAEHMPAYLESTNPANLHRYETLGFRPRSRFGPENGPVITTMWRDAR